MICGVWRYESVNRARSAAIRSLLSITLLQLLLFWLIPAVLVFASTGKVWNVLVLHSYHKGLSWTDSLVKGIDEGFADSGLAIEISHEFMDSKRIFSEDYLNQLAELYRQKFTHSNFDIVLSTDDLAFSFLRKHHDELFPGKPVVFSGVNTFDASMLDGHPGFTGVLEAFDIPATLNIALRLHPQASRFVVISDQTITGKANEQLFRKALHNISRPMQVLFLDNHTMAEVRDQVSRLSGKDIAIWLSFTADREGSYFSFRQSARLISEVSKAPLYSFWDFHLGYGIVGGKLASGYFQGRKAAELAGRILQGEAVADVPVVTKSPNRYMFDQVQLRRFHIDPDLLPPDSVIINRPRTFYAQYKVVVWTVLAGFVALATIIMLLLVNISSRRSANREMTRTKNRFQRIFDDAAVVLFEADFTAFYTELAELKKRGFQDLDFYFTSQPDESRRLANLVRIIDCNNAAVALYGAAGKEQLLTAMDCGLRVLCEEGAGKIVSSLDNDESRLEWEAVNTRLDGRQLNVLISMKPARVSGEAKSVALSVVDVTERKRYTEELRMSEDRFRTLFESAASGIALLDLRGNYLRVNEAICSLLGYSRQEMEQKNWRDITHPEDVSITSELISILLKGKPYSSLEKRYIHKEGRVVWALLNVGLNTDPDGQPINFVAQMQDITQIKNVQARIRLKEERYRQLVEADLSGFYIANPSGKVLLCNRVFADILGFASVKEVVGRNISTCYHGRDVWSGLVGDLWQGKKIENNELVLLRKDGASLTVLFNAIGRLDDQGRLLEIQGHMINISQQKNLEERLVRAQKMEAMGLMAGGVAHDLNNILSGITGYPELMLATLAEDSPLRKPLQSIRESGLRAAAVVADLLTVARGAANVREVHNVFSLVKEYFYSPECLQFRDIYPDVAMRIEARAKNAAILCSPVHIKKCLMNLVTNGLEAIKGSGWLAVTISEQSFSEDPEDGQRAREYVVLSVTDSGTGISERDKQRIFEPFYTKKVMGKSGTGLGLAVVWNTVQDHGGRIKVESGDEGTTFKLYFPRHVNLPAEPAEMLDAISLEGAGERILVVDDEPVLRDIAGQILTDLGYQVETVDSGEAALAFLHDRKVDLVLLDMFMDPGINGCETYQRILQRHPGQKAVIASGYSKSDDVKKAMELGVGSFIEKPYSIEQLGRAVRGLL